MFAKTLSILAATAGLAFAGAAGAQTYPSGNDRVQPNDEVIVVAPGTMGGGREIKSTPVYFDDLDLNSRQGGYTLLMRIRGAATQVCSPSSSIRDVRDTSDYQRCVRRAIDHAVEDVGMPSVQDAYYDLGVGTADLPG